ncbi:MAG: proline racemase family protein [Bacteroidales bacterium]|nr:proline racemase family protein [Bacteroidales bacterium]
MEQHEIKHPFEEDLSFLYGTIITGEPHDTGHHSRNVCVFAGGEVDRSSTGSGVSARAAIHHAKGKLKTGEEITVESILDMLMTVKVTEKTKYGPFDALIREVSGTASFTGQHRFYFDTDDPIRRGFIFK